MKGAETGDGRRWRGGRQVRAMGCSLAVALAVVLFLPRANAAWPSYERWETVQELSAQERHVLAAARMWARSHHLALTYDARLGRAARRLLPWAATHMATPLPLERLRHAGWRQGWTDGTLAAVALEATSRHAVPATVYGALEKQLGHTDLTSIGVAVQGDDVVLALSHRLLRLAPLPAHVGTGDHLWVTGRLLDPGITAATLVIGLPDGAVQRIPVNIEDNKFEHRVDAGDTRGTLDFQILIERGHGPEVAVQCPVGVGVPPWTPEDSTNTNAPTAEPDENTDPHAALTALIWGVRDAHGLTLPPVLASLQTLAQAHAEDMQAHHFFAHASPEHGDPTVRLRAAAQPYHHVVENLADAATVDAAFWQWMHSPSHRANVLDARVNALGVGIARETGGKNLLAVRLMADVP